MIILFVMLSAIHHQQYHSGFFSEFCLMMSSYKIRNFSTTYDVTLKF